MNQIIKQRPVHPFPARMAPEIALKSIIDLESGGIILDPMVGSGTTLHYAALNGYKTIGYDLDPLAVLLTKVSTRKINIKRTRLLAEKIISEANKLKLSNIELPWIDNDKETGKFIKFWFARKQINSLRKIAYTLYNYRLKKRNIAELNAISIAFSRIIITKKIGASLAWDISHSRPHKMRYENDYDVLIGFKNSVERTLKYLTNQENIKTNGVVSLGDARSLNQIRDNSIDRVITSPPYLNAIDYMRGHKFSLIWLGYSISELRQVRSNAIGVERRHLQNENSRIIDRIYDTLLKNGNLSERQKSMIKRYIEDSLSLMSEIARVLKTGKKATLVVGNSNLNGVYIKNSSIFCETGKIFNLQLSHTWKREIPVNKRYLPVPLNNENSLAKRMKHEMVMTFIKKSS